MIWNSIYYDEATDGSKGKPASGENVGFPEQCVSERWFWGILLL